jgi:hypothetical protein
MKRSNYIIRFNLLKKRNDELRLELFEAAREAETAGVDPENVAKWRHQAVGVSYTIDEYNAYYRLLALIDMVKGTGKYIPLCRTERTGSRRRKPRHSVYVEDRNKGTNLREVKIFWYKTDITALYNHHEYPWGVLGLIRRHKLTVDYIDEVIADLPRRLRGFNELSTRDSADWSTDLPESTTI